MAIASIALTHSAYFHTIFLTSFLAQHHITCTHNMDAGPWYGDNISIRYSPAKKTLYAIIPGSTPQPLLRHIQHIRTTSRTMTLAWSDYTHRHYTLQIACPVIRQ